MKKFTFLFLFALSSSLFFTHSCKAQYNVLYDFNFGGPLGSNAHGDLTPSHGILYGMAQIGGVHGYGTIFSVDSTGAGYRDLYNFDGTLGAYGVIGSLLIHGSTMYGMASQGGGGTGAYCPSGCGCVFSVDTDGTNYKELLAFNGINGGFAWGNLTLLGSKLFGLSIAGGTNNTAGCGFTIDTSGHNYKDILDFNQTNGAAPEGSFTMIGDKLYGMAAAGGAHSDGCIFSLDTNGNAYKDLHDFNGTDGNGPGGSLLLAGGKFYGLTIGGGTHDSGVIFSIDTNGSNYKKLYDLDRSTGAYPRGTLCVSGSKLYGLADLGGASDSGAIFSIDTNGSNFTKIFDFTGVQGTNPFGSPILSGENLYGMTSNGGTKSSGGVIFSFDKITTGTNEVKGESGKVKIYPNPSNGVFTIGIRNYVPQSDAGTNVEVYNVLGEQVYSQFLPAGLRDQFLIDLTGQPSGVYLYRIVANSGNLVGEGKLIIEK
jgi:uncharacterized repeat protein (TIGR03803 family)